MSHASQRHFVKIIATQLPHYFSGMRVLEVGSLDINGSVRDFFKDCEYTGLDVAPGPNVDIVCEGQKYDAPSDSYDVVISCEVMEHNPYWAETFQNMIRLCRPGGLIVMTCATTGRREHGTTRTTPKDSPLTVELGWDYYRNLTKRDFEKAIDFNAAFSVHHFQANWGSFDLLFYGIKNSPESKETGDLAALRHAVDQYAERENSCKRHRYRALMATMFGDRYFYFIRRLIWGLNYLHND
ncbi:MAG: class I SAM-dependent methyltransferase [Pseudomonadota bacterium]